MAVNRGTWGTCRARAGFSIVELLFVMIIAGLLMTIGTNSFRKFETYQSVENSRNAVIQLARRARSVAIEKGTTVQIDIDATNKRASVSSGGTTIDQIYFSELGIATMTNSNGATITVCYNARGFALTSTCTTAGLPATVTFGRGGQSGVITVQPLGRIVKS
jgi:prepilin-type N-terminal cleavage/methylation domain-containing protein